MGCRWKDTPAIYGPPKTLYNRNVRWAAKGVWRPVFETLAAAGGPPTKPRLSPDSCVRMGQRLGSRHSLSATRTQRD